MSFQKITDLGGSVVIDPTRDMDEQKTHLMDALLDVLYGNSKQHSQSLVTAGLTRLRGTVSDTNELRANSISLPTQSKAKSRLLVWGLTAAAMALIAVTLRVDDTSQTAVAAVNRSIAQSRREIGRSYRVTTRFRLSEIKMVDRNVDLFVKGANRFAIRSESLLAARPVWLGSDRGAAWVVPPWGPVLEGDTKNLMQWVLGREEIGTPYLHISTILTRMRDFYALQSRPDQWVKIGKQSVQCRHVVGTLDSESSFDRPDRIELWADAESGFAVRVMARWNLEKRQALRESVDIQFIGPVELDDRFFTPDAHGGRDRRRINFRNVSETK